MIREVSYINSSSAVHRGGRSDKYLAQTNYELNGIDVKFMFLTINTRVT